MKIVLDSNVLFSALISGKDLYIDIFRSLEIYTPDFIFIELSKYDERILKKTRLSEEFSFFVKELFSQITVIPKFVISKESYQKAFSLCNNIDPKDTPFVSLAIDLNLPLWTNDKKLIDGLLKKGFSKIVTTEEIFKLIFEQQ